MIKNSHKQIGSAHIVIVVVLVILLVGALGFIFWQNYMVKNTQQSPVVQSVSDDSQKNDAASSADERYVALEDWGVKFKIDNHLNETTIGKVKSESADSYLFFSERVEQAFKKACPGNTNPNSGAGWNIIRTTDKPAVGSDGRLLDMNGELINDTAINGYFYSAGVTGAYCPPEHTDQASDDSIDYSGDTDAVLASLRTLQPIK